MADLLVEEFSDCESITYEAPKTTNPENGQFYLTAPLHDPSSAAGPSSSSSAPLDIRDIGVAINTRLRRTATLHAPLRGSGTAFYDVDDSGTYDPEIERAEAQAEIQRKRARARARKNEVTNLASFSEEDDDELRESSVSRPSSEAGPSTKKAKKRVKVEHSTRKHKTKVTSKRHSEEEDEQEEIAVRPRKFAACEPCRLGKRTCRLKKKDPGPCPRCRNQRIDCTFLYLPMSNASSAKPSKIIANKGKKGKTTMKEHLAAQHAYDEQTQTDIHKTGFKHASKRQTKLYDQAKRRSKGAEVARIAGRGRHSDPYQIRGTVRGHEIIFIETAFCHPIALNWIPPPHPEIMTQAVDSAYAYLSSSGAPYSSTGSANSPNPGAVVSVPTQIPTCSFHPSTRPFYPLFGKGGKLVEVIPWPLINGHGYEELSGGHWELGCAEDKLCVECTTERLKIVLCPEHEMQELVKYDGTQDNIDTEVRRRGQDKRVFSNRLLEASFRAVLEDDIEGKGEGKLAWETKWCSICPSPAEFHCSPSSSISASPAHLDIGDDEQGCGLKLCAACQDLFVKVVHHQNLAKSTTCNVHQHQQEEKKEPSVLDEVIRLAGAGNMLLSYPFGLRSDVDLLRTDGEMMIRLGKMAEQEEEGEGDLT